MANTTNLGLGKLAGTEKLKTFPSMQADNMDTLDTAIGAGFGKNSKPSISQSMKNLGGGMAVLCDNNTHAAIPAGHYAYVMNHGTLTEGLYQNLSGSQIATNATLSGSNLTAVSGGGLNSLYSKFAIEQETITTGFNADEINSVSYVKIGTTVTVVITIKGGVSGQAWHNGIATGIPSKIRPKNVVYGTHRIDTSNDLDLKLYSTLNTDGTIQYISNKSPAATVPISFTYPVSL